MEIVVSTSIFEEKIENVFAYKAPEWHKENHPYSTSKVSLVFDMNVEEGDVIYAVVADYNSGNTYNGVGPGYAQVLDVFTRHSEAMDLAITAKHQECRCFTHNDKDYYADWIGYFEELNSMSVWRLIVKPGPPDPFSNYGKVLNDEIILREGC
jgi:hypothetical protein